MLRAAGLTQVSTNRWTLWSRPLLADSLWQTDHRLHLSDSPWAWEANFLSLGAAAASLQAPPDERQDFDIRHDHAHASLQK